MKMPTLFPSERTITVAYLINQPLNSLEVFNYSPTSLHQNYIIKSCHF
jgi:hypothetical protein